MIHDMPTTLESAMKWIDDHAVAADFISDMGLDEEGGGVNASTIIELKFGAPLSQDIAAELNAARPGAWTYKPSA